MRAFTLTLVTTFLTNGTYGTIIDGYAETRPRDDGPGGFVEIVDPTGISVGQDNFNSPNLFGFNERQNVENEGVLYNSHYIFFDPETLGENDGYSMQGWVEFDSPVVSIIEDRTRQMTNDAIFGLSSVTYLYPTLIGLEPGNRAFVDPTNANRVIWDTDASTPGDWVRVLTSGDPNPELVPDSMNTAALATIGMFSIFAMGLYRRKVRRSHERAGPIFDL